MRFGTRNISPGIVADHPRLPIDVGDQWQCHIHQTILITSDVALVLGRQLIVHAHGHTPQTKLTAKDIALLLGRQLIAHAHDHAMLRQLIYVILSEPSLKAFFFTQQMISLLAVSLARFDVST